MTEAERDDPYTIPAGTDIGHVHLKVADLDRALRFYQGVLGFELTQRYGTEAAFLAAGGYHHHIALNTWHSAGGDPPPPSATGRWERPSAAWGRQESGWTAPVIMGSVRHSTCGIPTATVSSCTGTGPGRSGPAMEPGNWRW
jgi:hypothetical protein